MFNLLVLLLCWFGCAPEQTGSVETDAEAHHVSIHADGLVRVDLLNQDEMVLETRRLERPTNQIAFNIGWVEGARSVRVYQTQDTNMHHFLVGEYTLQDPGHIGPFSISIDAPMGQGSVSVTHGKSVEFALVEGATAQVVATVLVEQEGDYTLTLGTSTSHHPQAKRGQRLFIVADVSDDTTLVVNSSVGNASVFVDVQPISQQSAASQLRLVAMPFPVDVAGDPDLARPADRVTLPAPWWRWILAKTALGTRNWGQYEPWAMQAVELENIGPDPINVAIRSVVLGADGSVDPIFRPRLRDADNSTGEISVLLRVPAESSAKAVIPVFVDDNRVPDAANTLQWSRRIEIAPLGSDTPLIEAERNLYITRGSSAASVGMWAAILAALGGIVLMASQSKRWLSNRRTSDLMTIAMFGALCFLVQTGGQLLGMGIGVLLGPFSTLFTGIIDDAFRTALLVTLLMMVPKPGTAALCVTVNALLGALALGQVGPTELLLLGNRIIWMEGSLWLSGVTRNDSWTQSSIFRTWLRFSFALGFASILSGACGLVLAVVLYRFFFAPWYIAMVLIGPCFLYVIAGCAIAVPFARSLREVSP